MTQPSVRSTAQSAAEPAARPGVSRSDVFSALGALGAIITLVTAVMYYFGWQRSAVQARAMSIDVSLFGYTSQDYVLRSISSLYLPLLVLLGLGLGWLRLHSSVVRLLRASSLAPGPRRAIATAWIGRLALAAATLSIACIVFALAAGAPAPIPPVGWLADRLRDRQWVVPLVLVLATLAASYLWWIRHTLAALSPSVQPLEQPPARAERAPARSLPLWQTLLPIALVAGTVLLGTFWMLEEYASAVGRGLAQQVARGVGTLPRTVVISPAPLGIDAPGVRTDQVGAADSPEVRYRTTGLRLLARSGGKVLLVHDGWNPGTGTVVVIADREELSWEFSR